MITNPSTLSQTAPFTESVLPVSNIMMMQLKSLTKDISKFYGIPFEEATAGVSTVEADVRHATSKAGDDKNLFVLTLDDAVQHSKRYRDYLEKYPAVAENIKVLYKQVRSIGRHAGGVIIGEDLDKVMPLIAVKGEFQTPWVEGTNVKHINLYGLVKYDILGLETLRIIGLAIGHIIRRHTTYKIEVNGTIYELAGDYVVRLMDGTTKFVRQLIAGDDIDEASFI